MPDIFVSYRSLDSAKVDALVARLKSLKNTDGTPRFNIWQDKHSIPDGHDWWESIVDGIINASVIIFMLSRESAQNINCRAELTYARKRNRPVIPLVLEDEYAYNPVTGKNDIDYWEHVPQELKDLRSQFLFYEGTSFVSRIETAIAGFEREPQRWRDMPAEKPSDPRDANDADNNSATIYDQACDFALRLELTTAERLFQRLVNANDPIFGEDSYQWIRLLRTYQMLLNVDARVSTRYKAQSLWQEYRSQFPRPFIDMFDPKDFAARFNSAPIIPKSTEPEYITRWKRFKANGKKNSDWQPYITTFSDLKIPDMSFCLVPPGTFLMGSNDISDREKPVHPQTLDQPYWIAQYPVTNAQWAQAVKAGIVPEPDEETSLDWYKNRVKSSAPVVGINWFQARDFALWLGCRLPTEVEWEYASRGSSNLIYPWGNEFVPQNVVFKDNSNRQTAVVGSRPTGNSWVGASDLSGNVWEWNNNIFEASYPYVPDDGLIKDGHNIVDVPRVLRGGAWNDSQGGARSAYRLPIVPDACIEIIGFRLVRPW